jgi:MYXO-CTERM domain-containing protein
VFGYNYSDEVVQSEGSVPNEGWLPPDISVHGHWSNNNLFESNTVEQVGIADYWGPTGPHVTYLRNRVVNDEARSDGRGEDEAIALDDHSNYQYLLGNVVEIGTLQDDGTPDMTTNVIHGHVESGGTVWDADIADHEIPVSYYWGCKPNFLGNKAWPLVGPDVTPSVDLPAGDRFASGAFIAPAYERGCDDGSTNPGAGGGITATGGSGGTTATGGSGGTIATGGTAGVTGTGGGTAGSGLSSSSGGAGQATTSTDEGSGCGCRAAGRGPAGAWALAGVALLGLLLRRRSVSSHRVARVEIARL